MVGLLSQEQPSTRVWIDWLIMSHDTKKVSRGIGRRTPARRCVVPLNGEAALGYLAGVCGEDDSEKLT